jgi:protein arginine kinase activator
MEKLFSQLLQKQDEVGSPSDAASPPPSELVCPGCGTTLAQFEEALSVGCSECYTVFEGAIEPRLRRMHGSIRHVGRTPRTTRPVSKVDAMVAALTQELAEAVSDEDYHKAAVLRDRIRHLKGELCHGVSEMSEM